MPIYEAGCNSCKMLNEVQRSIKIGPITECENCGSKDLTTIFYAVDVCVRVDDPINFGHLADRNRDNMSQIEFADKTYEHKLASDKGRKELGIDKKGPKFNPWWRKGEVNTKLATMNTKEKNNYVEKGIKPAA